jgi:hypothetical protein
LGIGNNILPTILATTLTNKITLVGASIASGRVGELVLHALRSDCAPDRAYGTGGTLRLHLPVARGASYESIDSIIPAQKGEALIAGSDGGTWLIGRLLANGRLDPRFGLRGWAKIVPPGSDTPGSLYPSASAIALEPSGRIMVGGDNGQAHCCVDSYVYALNGAGQIDTSYGPVNVFGQGAYIDQLLARRMTPSLSKVRSSTGAVAGST